MKKSLVILVLFLLSIPNIGYALTYDELKPQVESSQISARAVIVLDQVTGEVLYKNHETDLHVPASLTKLLTVLVALDAKPSLTKRCTLLDIDQVGGVQITGKVGVQYTMQGLMYAALVPSANNAARALARCTGLSDEVFVQRMNEKARALGATNSIFVEPTGLSEKNMTTAEDLAKIANAAFSTERVRNIARTQKYRLCSTGVVRCQTLSNTNQLLGDKEITTVAGKTGYLDEALYNFAGSFRDSRGKYYIVVVLGSNNKESRFLEAKQLVKFAADATLWQDQMSIH